MRKRYKWFTLLLALAVTLTGCADYAVWEAEHASGNSTYIETDYQGPSLADYVNQAIEAARELGLYNETDYSDIGASNPQVPNQQTPSDSSQNRSELLKTLADIQYEGAPYITVNDNEPYFTKEDFACEPFESYSELDGLGRTGTAFACLHPSLMPEDEEERGDISSVRPSGWVQKKYDGISNGGWIYNRCHLIAWSLAGENANEKNLMTGTRYFNIEGMLDIEMTVLNYLDDHEGGKVLYRAEPVYAGNDLLAKGLLLEAQSFDGEIKFCVYVFNVQPGIEIDYATGESWEAVA